MTTDEKEIVNAYNKENLKRYIENRKRKTIYNDFLSNPTLRKATGDVQGKSLLDIGCGYGSDLLHFQHKGAKTYGVELNKEFINYAKSNPELQNIIIKQGSIYKIPFKEKFDICIANQVLDQVKDLKKAFRTVAQRVKKNGIFVFAIAHPLNSLTANYSESIKNYFNVKKGTFKPAGANIEIPYYYRNFDKYSEAIATAGFVIERIFEPQPLSKAKKLFPAEDFKRHSSQPEVLVMRLKRIN